MIGVCPTDEKMFNAFTKFVGNNYGKAMEIYAKNNYEYPSDFLEHYEKLAEVEESAPGESTNANVDYLKKKEEILTKAKGILKKRIQQLNAIAKDNVDMKKPLEELETLFKNNL